MSTRSVVTHSSVTRTGLKRSASAALLLSLILSLSLTGCTGSPERNLQAGQKALAEEKFSDAAAAFTKAGSYQDAEALLQYTNAWLSLEGGDFASALAGFRSLGDYKDCVLMCSYCQAREQDALAQSGFATGNTDAAVDAVRAAFELYSALPLFRDSDTRAAECRDLLFQRAEEWMNQGSYEAASTAFQALGTWLSSDALATYCDAAVLSEQGRYTDAAALFDTIPDTLDAQARASGARSQAYQIAVDLMAAGDYGAAVSAFQMLGGYQDAEARRDQATAQLIRRSLQSGSFAEALEELTNLSDLSPFPSVLTSEGDTVSVFLNSFLNAWMNAHAAVMNSFFGRSLLDPYLDYGGELYTLIQNELTDDIPASNYGFLFEGMQLLELLSLDDGYLAAKAKVTSSWYSPEGPVNADETLWILLDTGRGSPLAMAVLSA